jgi:DNA-binding transcriptional LysR family regulator
VQVELITDYRMLDLSRREADVFISFFKPAGKRLSIKKLGEFKVSLFASKHYLAAHGHPTTMRELEDHVFVDFIDELVHVRENRWLSDILRPHQIVFRSTSLIAQYLYASNGQAIAMLPSFVAANNRDLVPVMPDLFTVRDIWLSVHEDLLHITRVKAILAFLEKRIAEDREFLKPQALSAAP